MSQIGSFILLFVNDRNYTDNSFVREPTDTLNKYNNKCFPKSSNPNVLKYPCMCIIHRRGFLSDVSKLVGERRGLYKKWRSGDRDPQDYMYVYRYEQNNQTRQKSLFVNCVTLGYYSTIELMVDLLNFINLTYIQMYRDCFIPENLKNINKLIEKTVSEYNKFKPIFIEPKPEPKPQPKP